MQKAERKGLTPEQAKEIVEVSSKICIVDALDAMEIVRIFRDRGEVYVPSNQKMFMSFVKMVGAIWYAGYNAGGQFIEDCIEQETA